MRSTKTIGLLIYGKSKQMWSLRLDWIQSQEDENLVELESLLGFFASFVLETEIVQQIMRWDMTVLRELPWYQEILSEGENRGVKQGLKLDLIWNTLC